MRFRHYNEEFDGAIILHYFQNNRIAVELYSWDEESGYWDVYARIAVNLPELPLDSNENETNWEFFAKTYSENLGLCEELERLGYIEATGRVVTSRYVDFPVYRLTDKFFAEKDTFSTMVDNNIAPICM